MNNTTFSPDYITIHDLFKNGTCLTYVPDEASSVFNYEQDLKEEYRKKHPKNPKCAIISKTAQLWPEKRRHNFHFFSNGVLIHNILPNKNVNVKIEKITTALKIRGYEIKEIHGPQNNHEYFIYNKFLDQISQEALLNYSYLTDIQVVPGLNKEQFLEACFANNNVVLTASKFENIDPQYRKYLALMADGKFYLSTDCCGSSSKYSPSVWRKFIEQYDDYVYCKAEPVLPEILDAIYQKAKEKDWFLDEKEFQKTHPHKKTLNTEQKKIMDEYVKGIIANRHCISVTSPEYKEGSIIFFIPPYELNYVLFHDGTLIITDLTPKDLLLHMLKKAFPDMSFKTQKVSEEYLKEINQQLGKTQKTAKQIFIEMLKQKARKLKKLLDIPHHEALDLAAKLSDWSDWKTIIRIEEDQAKHCISVQKKRMDIFQWCVKEKRTKAKNFTEWDYQEYLERIQNIKKLG